MVIKIHLGLLAGAFLLILLTVSPLSAGQTTSADESILKRMVPAFYSTDENIVNALLRFGRENKVSLGLILNRQICSTTTGLLKIEHTSVQSVVEELKTRMPSYSWNLEDEVVIFTPKEIPGATAGFLSLTVSPYSIGEDTLQAQAFYAWMNMRATLRPKEGTAFNILSSSKSAKWPPLVLGHVTIQQVLDRLVGRDGGGAWVLFPFENLAKVADHRPFLIASYASDPLESAFEPCTTPVGH